MKAIVVLFVLALCAAVCLAGPMPLPLPLARPQPAAPPQEALRTSEQFYYGYYPYGYYLLG